MAEALVQDSRPAVASQTLDAVAREIAVALGEARIALETHVEQPDNPQFLQRCEAELRQVQGVLRVLEIHGAALLAEEMYQVARYLQASMAEHKNQSEALEALMRAMVQLPGYLERVVAGGRDLALVLLPLLNDMRAVRGSALLSEGTLLVLNLKSDRQASPAQPDTGEEGITVPQWARRVRARYQVGLIGWIRGERVDQNLEILANVANRLEHIATMQPVFQLWWVIGAIIEALREHGVDSGVSIKRLLGLGDREIRRLYEEGEQRYAQDPPVELLNNLLYYIARASSSGPRVSAVRSSFRLGELLPVDESIEQERENLSAPSVKLMQTVAAAIREDLSKIKDVLDIFLRRGGASPDELAPQVELLRKIGDTLGVLGLGEQRARVQAEIARLEQLVASGERPADGVLVDIAATLIRVEDHLDDELVGMILPRRADSTAPPVDVDFQQVQAAVLRECVVNLARVKEYVGQSVGGTLDTAGFDNWPDLVRGIQAGLLMLDKTRAVQDLERITGHLRAVLQPGVRMANASLDRLADAIVSIEYYMETLQSGRADPWYMLDNAESALDAVDAGPAPALPVAMPEMPAEYERTQFINPPHTHVGPGTQVLAGTHPAFAPPPSRPVPLLESTDPELIALYIEEAREEAARIEQQFPAWDQNPLDEDALVQLRRSFHTLKGSGRMVGARELADFSWAIESLLNRLLDKSVSRSPVILNTLRDAVRALPQLVTQLAEGIPPTVDVALLAARAHALAAGRPLDAVVSATQRGLALRPEAAAVAAPPLDLPLPDEPRQFAPHEDPPTAIHRVASVFEAAPLIAPDLDFQEVFGEPPAPEPAGAPAPPAAQAEEASEPDTTLREIYARETDSHVAVVRAYLTREAGQSEPHALPEPVYRACHTLAGSSKMAAARHGIRLAQPLDHWLRKAFDSGVGLLDGDLKSLEDCMQAMESISRNLDAETGFFMTHEVLRDRIAQAEQQLEQRILLGQSVVEPPSMMLPQNPSQGAPLAAAPAFAPEPVPEPAAAPAAELPRETASAPAPAFDYDPEIAAIFSEEATELLEAAQGTLAALGPHDQNHDALISLKRPLHTLKGGARMAGVTTMGDLAHELETLITRLEVGLVPWGPASHEALQASLDELARMRDLLANGRPVGEARTLVERVHALGEPASAVQAPPVQPVAALPEPEPMPVLLPVEDAVPLVTPAEESFAELQVPAQPPGEVLPVSEPAVAEPVAALRGAPAAEPPAAFWPADRAFETEPPPAPIVQAPALASVPAVAVHEPPSESVFEPVAQAVAVPLPGEPAEPAVPDFIPMRAPLPVPAPPLAAALVPPGREPSVPGDRPELARVDAELLNQLLNSAGEVSIARSRVEQQLGSVDFNLGELSRTVTRLKEQLRKLEIETETQILHRHEGEAPHRGDFDPLELDRYSSIQQFSRALAETANDVASIQQLLESLTQDTQNLLQQQGRTITELQNGLMRTRMVSFQRHVQRLSRIVRQTAADTQKQVELTVEGASGEFDRQVLERMLPPLEHMLRNAVVHGIESPADRLAHGKPETGQIHLSLRREGAEVILVITDDGIGMNLAAIREKGINLGLIQAGQQLSDEAVMQLVLEPGFSTATRVTQAAGRGVGMDVVATEVKKLGGALNMETTAGQGTRFTIRLPFTLAVSHALVVRIGDEHYALPLPTVEGVVRLSRDEIAAHLGPDAPPYLNGGHKYRLQHLGLFVSLEPAPLPEQDVTLPVVLVRAGEHSTGLVAEELIGSREIVVKSVGPQVASIRGISGATILGDGKIVIILDIGALLRAEWRGRPSFTVPREKADRRVVALVVDDSITVRRVTQRLLERNGMRVLTARDGMDAVAVLQETIPDIILLDIEMPRMDGYEVAAQVRGDPRTRDVPIIMITSRTGEKHRARAIELGVDDYLGKPYQESQLLDAIAPLVAHRLEALGLPPR